MKKTLGLMIALFLLGAVQASATVLTDVPEWARIPIPTMDYFGAGPITYGNYTWTSTNASTQGGAAFQGGAVFGYTGLYGFVGNGYWDGGLGPMIGLNDSTDSDGVTDSMTFAFTNPVNVLGDFFNYAPDSSNPTTLAVYDASHNLIESTTLGFHTGGGVNQGQWIGFSETTPIAYFTVTDNFVGLADPATVPEPGTLLLCASGLAGFAGALRRRFAR